MNILDVALESARNYLSAVMRGMIPEEEHWTNWALSVVYSDEAKAFKKWKSETQTKQQSPNEVKQ